MEFALFTAEHPTLAALAGAGGGVDCACKFVSEEVDGVDRLLGDWASACWGDGGVGEDVIVVVDAESFIVFKVWRVRA